MVGEQHLEEFMDNNFDILVEGFKTIKGDLWVDYLQQHLPEITSDFLNEYHEDWLEYAYTVWRDEQA